MDERKQRFSGKPVADQILLYYKTNHIQKFSFSRPFTRKDPLLELDNEFANLWLERTVLVTTYPLPGILRWFPVNEQLTEVTEISPLRNAIETLEKANKELKNFVIHYSRDKMAHINPLSLLLTGNATCFSPKKHVFLSQNFQVFSMQLSWVVLKTMKKFSSIPITQNTIRKMKFYCSA